MKSFDFNSIIEYDYFGINRRHLKFIDLSNQFLMIIFNIYCLK